MKLIFYSHTCVPRDHSVVYRYDTKDNNPAFLIENDVFNNGTSRVPIIVVRYTAQKAILFEHRYCNGVIAGDLFTYRRGAMLSHRRIRCSEELKYALDMLEMDANGSGN